MTDSAIGLDVVDEQRSVGGVLGLEEQGLGLRGEDEGIEVAVCLGNLADCIYEGVIGLGGGVDGVGHALEGVEAGAGGATEHDGLIELLCDSERQAGYQLVVKCGGVVAELVGERLDDSKRVALHILGGEGVLGYGLVLGLGDPIGGRLASDDGDGQAVAGEVDTLSELHDCGAFERLGPNLVGNGRGQGDRGLVDAFSHVFSPCLVKGVLHELREIVLRAARLLDFGVLAVAKHHGHGGLLLGRVLVCELLGLGHEIVTV